MPIFCSFFTVCRYKTSNDDYDDDDDLNVALACVILYFPASLKPATVKDNPEKCAEHRRWKQVIRENVHKAKRATLTVESEATPVGPRAQRTILCMFSDVL